MIYDIIQRNLPDIQCHTPGPQAAGGGGYYCLYYDFGYRTRMNEYAPQRPRSLTPLTVLGAAKVTAGGTGCQPVCRVTGTARVTVELGPVGTARPGGHGPAHPEPGRRERCRDSETLTQSLSRLESLDMARSESNSDH